MENAEKQITFSKIYFVPFFANEESIYALIWISIFIPN